ncbi:MAG: DsbA family protein [Nanoarchaeota archaeon]|nr:DsbA family protein [Nanoarchaeota archaeon]
MNNKVITITVVMFVLILAGSIIYARTTGAVVKDIPSEAEARWIGEHSVLYAQAGCSHCIEQEKLFGDNYKYLTVVDCLEDIQACILAGIEGTPTWIINGEKYVGVQSIEKLKELTDYQE